MIHAPQEMDQRYRVVYHGRLRRGQTRSSVAGRLSEALGRDRAVLENLLDGPEQILLVTASETEAQRLFDIFAQAGAEVQLERPGEAQHDDIPAPDTAHSRPLKPSVPPSFSQRLWLVRAAAVLLVLGGVAGLGFGLLIAALLALFLSYSWVLDLFPWPSVVLPVYGTLIVVLLLVIAGLVKPFVRFESRLPGTIKLERAYEPLLFDFIGHVCEVIRVPYPRAVLVDMSASVSAGGQPGSDLTIGLPVIASVTTAELAGLVARALTLHISGISGRLGRFVVGSVQRLYDAVHGRDAVDRALQAGLQARNPLRVHAAKELSTLLRLSRRVLGYLLKEAIGTSAAAMQSIEGHRDRHQAWIVGADKFSRSLRLMRLVRFVADRSEASVRGLWDKGQPLPADLPVTLAARIGVLTKPETFAKVIALAEREQEAVPQFHLADTRRIERIARSGIEPTLTCVTPAHSFMRGFAVLSRRLSLLHYRNQLCIPATPGRLQAPAGVEQRALETLGARAYVDVMPVMPRQFVEKGRTVPELLAATRKLSAAVAERSGEAQQTVSRYRDAENSLFESLHEELMLRYARSTRRTRRHLESVQVRCRALEGEQEKAYAELATHGELIARRLANGVALLERPETAARLRAAPALAVQAVALCEALDKIQQQMTCMREMAVHTAVVEMLLAQGPGAAVKDGVTELEAEINTRLTALRVALKRAPNPLDDKTYIFEYAHAGFAPTSPCYAALDEASAVLSGLLRMKGRLIARLAVLTKAAEDAWMGNNGLKRTG